MATSANLAMLLDNTAEASRLLKAISNEKRLQVLCMLATSDELHVGAIANSLRLSMSAASQHLASLRHGRLIEARRDGANTFYRLADHRTRALLVRLQDVFAT